MIQAVYHTLLIQLTGSASSLGALLFGYVVATLALRGRFHWLDYSTLTDPWLWLVSCVCTLVSFLHPDYRYTLAILPAAGVVIYSTLLFPQMVTLYQPMPSSVTPPTNLTVLTWNVVGGRANQACLNHTLMTHQPDVALFQEAGGFDIEAVTRYPYKIKSKNLVILSQFEITEPLEFGRHPINGHDMGLQVSLHFAQNQPPITLINTYLPKPFIVPSQLIYKAQDRIDATSRYIDAIEQAEGEVILVGDHNMGMRAPEYARLSQYLQDTWLEQGRGFGFTANHHPIVPPSVRVDYLWHSSGIITNSVEVLPADCSDHFGVMAGFHIE